MALEKIPREILLAITEWLPLRHKVRLAQVSKWFHASVTPELYRVVGSNSTEQLCSVLQTLSMAECQYSHYVPEFRLEAYAEVVPSAQ